ncbi:MAG TPA: hypothetical protein VFQ06_08270 [Nitrospira sp.]|nr:hypothetical protein [Nitrospira sp.]
MTLRRRVLGVGLIAVYGLLVMSGCTGLSLAEQEQKIRNNDLILRKLEPRAFVRAWGMPTYQRMEFMPFFGMKDGSLVPRSRLPVGASPPGWEAGVDAGEALFLAYPDRGWLIVFLDETFVYREELTPDKLHEIGRSWAHEDKFRTKIELQPAP